MNSNTVDSGSFNRSSDKKTENNKNGDPDQLLTDLILPDGDKLDIEKFKRRLDDSGMIDHRRVMLPEQVETVWEKTLEEITEIEKETILEQKIEEVHEPKPSLFQRITALFLKDKVLIEEYDIEKHGPIVNLSLDEDYPYEEAELYPVNEPFAYVRISYNPSTHTYIYQALEPKLSPGEKELFQELKIRISETLDINFKKFDKSNAEEYLKEKVLEMLWDYQIQLDTLSFVKIMYFMTAEFMGYAKIDPLMHDPYLEDISCDGPHTPIYIYHRKHESVESDLKFEDENELDSFVVRIAQICGRHISMADPLLDATMPDGSRIQLTLGREITTRGSSFTIRKFKESPITPPDLIEFNTYSTAIVAYLWLAVENSKNIIFAGGTASGKTSSMNALALFIPPESKIVSMEDTRELNLPHSNWIAGVTRQTFIGNESGTISLYDLLKAALRQRPEYMLVGEVRGEETYVLFQAMSTGHTTFSTLHADSVQSVVHRLENPPINIPRIMLQSLNIVIIQVQVRLGEKRVRRAKNITEIVGVDNRTGELLTNEVFKWDASKDEFAYSGRSYVLESIVNNRGWDDKRLKQELKNRQEILEWSRMKKVKHFEDVAKIVTTYYREPKTLMDIVRKDLYGS
jgi:flagellar protein FlaI